MKTILAALLIFQSTFAFGDTSALTDLKSYLVSPARFTRVGYQTEDKRTFERELSKEEFVEIFNATATLCKAEVSPNGVIISETKSRSLVLGVVSLELPFESATSSNKVYESTVSYSDTTPIYYQSTEEIVIQLNGAFPLKYEMNFAHSNSGYFSSKPFAVTGIAINDLLGPGAVRDIRCELNDYLAM